MTINRLFVLLRFVGLTAVGDWRLTYTGALRPFCFVFCLQGVVGPVMEQRVGNLKILNYDFVHKSHYEMFGFQYPPVFKNWHAAPASYCRVCDTACMRGCRLFVLFCLQSSCNCGARDAALHVGGATNGSRKFTATRPKP